MVEGTGLENQSRKLPQVRILSLPPMWWKFYEGCGIIIMGSLFVWICGNVAQLVRA